jgi:glutathione synthase/RimK-type ligase-like ATP-grasp enzyme
MTKSTRTVVFATCNAQPALQEDDLPAVASLKAANVSVVPAPWNGPFEPFERADLVVIRSTWDYWDAPEAFRAWLERLKTLRRVANDPALMLWNLNKSYLLDLAARGAPLPPTRLVTPDAASIAVAMDALGIAEAVVKPLVSGGAIGLSRVRRGDSPGLESAAAALMGAGMVQPVIPEIATEGETSLVYFDGAFSHAVVKHPKPGDIRIQTQHGGKTRSTAAPDWAVAEGRRIIEMLPASATYARVDVVLRGQPGLDPQLWLMEVEVLEPSLYLEHAPPGASTAFAAALMRMMD